MAHLCLGRLEDRTVWSSAMSCLCAVLFPEFLHNFSKENKLLKWNSRICVFCGSYQRLMDDAFLSPTSNWQYVEFGRIKSGMLASHLLLSQKPDPKEIAHHTNRSSFVQVCGNMKGELLSMSFAHLQGRVGFLCFWVAWLSFCKLNFLFFHCSLMRAAFFSCFFCSYEGRAIFIQLTHFSFLA